MNTRSPESQVEAGRAPAFADEAVGYQHSTHRSTRDPQGPGSSTRPCSRAAPAGVQHEGAAVRGHARRPQGPVHGGTTSLHEVAIDPVPRYRVYRTPVMSDHSAPVIGRDLRPAGRLVRILAGLLFLLAAVSTGSSMGVWLSFASLAVAVVSLLGTALVYTIVVAALGERLLARANPWLVAVGMVIPLAILSTVPVVPAQVVVGAELYVGLAMLVQAVIGYGGCEIVGVPTLLLRRRYTVYCVLNGADVVEAWLQERPRWMAWAAVLLSLVLTMAVIAATEAIGKATGFWVAYLLFLLAGFAIGRIVSSRSRASTGEAA